MARWPSNGVGVDVAKILIIDDVPLWGEGLSAEIEAHHTISNWSVSNDISDHLRKEDYEIILLNLQLRRADSFSLLKQILQASPYTPVIGLSASDQADLIVKAVKKGAFDVIVPPFFKEKILLSDYLPQ